MSVVKVCRYCNKEYEIEKDRANRSSYCSKACQIHDYPSRFSGIGNPRYSKAGERVCQNCGKVYYSYNKTRKFCSHACYCKTDSSSHNLKKAIAAIKGKGKGRKCICKHCGVHFYSRNERLYCTNCAAYANSKPRRLLVCQVCGKVFYSKRRRKTCSDACLSVHKADIQRGDRSHLWQGGKVDQARKVRNDAQYKLWRKAVFDRDNYICQMCGQRGGNLTAHHIQPFSKNHLLRLVVENGITLCWTCHVGIKGRESIYESQFYTITGGVKFVQLELVPGAIQ